jgi:hypothetical protein
MPPARPGQTTAIEKLGLIAPPTSYACNALLTFINFGNIAFEGTRAERISLSKKYQDDWLGKKIRGTYIKKGEEGKILWLVARMSTDGNDIRKDFTDKFNPLPFLAVVHWIRLGRQQQVPLSGIQLI